MHSSCRKQVAAVVLTVAGLIFLCIAVFLTLCEGDPRHCLTVGGAGGGALLMGLVVNTANAQRIKRKGHM
jgi:hypothetical protein